MSTLTVYKHMCKAQQEEIADLLQAADDIGAAATSSNAHGYETLMAARAHFKSLLEAQHEHYRMCIEVE